MNIDWMCLLKAIGVYLIVGVILMAIIAALWAVAKGFEWVLGRVFGVGNDTVGGIGMVLLILLVAAVFVIRPIYMIYQSTCP